MLIVKKKITELVPSTYNPRKISPEELAKLKKSIAEFGYIEPIIINKRTGHIVGGHQRLKALLELNYEDVECVEIDIDENKERVLNVALNKISGEWDFPKLKELFDELHLADVDLTDTGFNMREIDEVFKAFFRNQTQENMGNAEKTEKPIIGTKYTVQEGELYSLGRHRLFCGDATNSEHVTKLLNGTTPLIMVTDPPYGVEYDPTWRNETNLSMGIKRPTRATGAVSNDDIIDWSSAYSLFKGDIAYVWHAGKYSSQVQQSIESSGFDIINQIIWVKPHFILSRGDYHWKHEPCWYAVRKGKNHNWQGDRTQTTVWEIAGMNCFGKSQEEGDDQTGHGTQKPIKCMAIPIKNNTRPNDAVYDPFGGSGTTLIACEQLNRICFMMELDPIYCGAILERYENLTGIKPLKIDR